MQTRLENGTLTLYPEGRIDSANAAAAEAEILAAAAEAGGADIAVDAERLQYISSAGLRVLLKLRKQVKKPVAVLNVSPEVYEIFETTGFTDLLNVRRRLREVSTSGLVA